MLSKFAIQGLLAGFIFAFSLHVHAADLPKDIHKFTLENGLTVVIAEDHDVPEVFGEVVVNVGAKDGPKEATGMAHYLEHMLFKGTKELGTTNWEKEKEHTEKIYRLYDRLGQTKDSSERAAIQDSINEASKRAQEYALPNEFESVLKKMGGTKINANTSYDRTTYFNKFPSHQLEKWLTLYAHRFDEPVFRDFQAELEVVYEEKNRALDNNIRQALQEYYEVAFPNHPYGQRSVIGTVDDLKNPSLNEMRDFFETWYVPNNMTLILSGDVTPQDAKPLIEKTFGKFEKKELPERKNYEEEEYDGREFYKKEMLPMKAVARGYSTVRSGHDDELALKVMDKVVTNSNKTGLLDELNRSNKILNAQYIHRIKKDRGNAIFLILPKQIFQGNDDAEEIVAGKIQELKDGDFSKKKLKAIRKQIYREWKLDMENIYDRGYQIGEAMAQDRDLAKYLNYPERVRRIRKEDVVRVANKYLDSNYISFHVGRGSIDKPEVQAPEYESITPKTDRRSSFAKKLDRMKNKMPEPDYIDFEQAITEKKLDSSGTLYHNRYDENDIYTLTVKFRAGNRTIDHLKYASSVSSLSSVKGMSNEELRSSFDTIGTKYSISSSRNSTRFSITGTKEGFPQALPLLNRLINALEYHENATEKIVNDQRNARIMERAQKQTLKNALTRYVLYGDSSKYIDRLKMTELKSLDPKDLEKAFDRVTEHECEIHYTGQRDSEEVEKLVSEKLDLKEDPKEGIEADKKDFPAIQEEKVYFVEKDDAVQNSIVFFIPGKEFELDQVPHIEAFNSYFGSSFTGLMFRQIRLYRSLAYATGSRYVTPDVHELGGMVGFIGTQADKTNKAISTFLGMKNEMPEKSFRAEMIRDHLINSTITEVPDQRGLTQEVVDWRRDGYDTDPRKRKMEEYRDLKFSDIEGFYEEYIKDSPTTLALVGNKEKVDIKELKEHGRLEEIDKNDLFEEAWLSQVFFNMVSGIAG